MINKFKNKYVLFFIIISIIFNIIDILFYHFIDAKLEYNFLYIFIFNIINTLFITSLIRLYKKIAFIIYIIFLLVIILLTNIEIVIYNTYITFIPIKDLINNSINATTKYSEEFINTLKHNIFMFIMFLAFAIFIVHISNFILNKRNVCISHNKKNRILNISICIISILFLISLSNIVIVSNNFSLNVEKFGIKSAMLKVRTYNDIDSNINIKNVDTSASDYYENEYNVLNIDFDNLDVVGENEKFKNINSYVKSIKPTEKNEWTGFLKEKNIILICAEAYSYKVLDEKLTPTLYRLTNNGINFNNFYVPSWGGSTTSGEFAFLMGLIPTNPLRIMNQTINKNMCFTLPSTLKKYGYTNYAYHNGAYDYYDRNLTHSRNIGFDKFLAVGNGLEKLAGPYPNDEDMFVSTFNEYKNKQPFCIYYMTVSGHAFYNNNDDDRVKKNIEKVKAVYGDKYREQVNNYICYQMYLDAALSKLIELLEENDMLKDTVICMNSDHFPYGLNSAAFTDNVDYLTDLYGDYTNVDFSIDKNKPILWSLDIEEKSSENKIVIDAPTSSIDLLPTLLNLFGVNYDSRLLVGRDVFSKREAIVPYNNNSFITNDYKYNINRGALNDRKIKNNKDKDNATAINIINYYKPQIKVMNYYSSFVVENDYYNYLYNNKNIDDSTKQYLTSIPNVEKIELKNDDYVSYKNFFLSINKYNNAYENSQNFKNENNVYMTFDVYDEDKTYEILDILNENNISATFFVGSNINNKNSGLLEKIKNGGHSIGIYIENDPNIFLSPYDFLENLYKIETIVYDATNSYTNLLKFKYDTNEKDEVNDKNDLIINDKNVDAMKSLIVSLNFNYYEPNVFSGDYVEKRTSELIYEYMVEGLSANRTNFYLQLNCKYENTMPALKNIIKYLLDKNIKMLPLDSSVLQSHKK